MEYTIVIAVIIICFLLFGLILWKADIHIESEQKKAGRRGERIASQVIQEVLNDGDVLLTNVHLSYEGSKTELDNVVINNRGVFIIEVKNYTGVLAGGVDDYKWLKNKHTDGGNFYQTEVKNPIKQVKRQIYILSSILRENGIRVWVEGYAILLEQNSPVEDEHILWSKRDIHEAIHVNTRNRLTNETKKKIVELLTE